MTEGERWAVALLEELRSARFTPAAWMRFLRRSFERARERRRERAREHRQALALGLAGIAGWAAVALLGRAALGAGGAAWWLAVVLMLDWHLGMLERPDGRPLRGLGTANWLCLTRAAAVPALLVLPPAALAGALAGLGVTDVLDGRLARSRDEVTRLGLWLDGAVDGFVLGAAALAESREGSLPAWVAALVVSRYALPWLGVAVAYFARASAPSRHGHVPARAPGVVLLTGLVAAPFWASGGAALAAAGAVAGLAALAATVMRSLAPRSLPSG